MSEPKKILSFSALPLMIEKIEGRVKHIAENAEGDPKFIPVMETVHLCLEVINAYAQWCNLLKEEIQKIEKLNKQQAELIRNHGIIKTNVRQ